MAQKEVIDALPYIDLGYDEPGVRENVFALIEEESRRYQSPKNYAEYLPQLNLNAFVTPLMKHEMERIQNNVAMETLSMKRYDLPPPSNLKLNDLSAWNDAIQNSYSQLEHQGVRIMNLNLMLDYHAPIWQRYLDTLHSEEQTAIRSLNSLKQEINYVNNNRKSYQETGGKKLKELEQQWVHLITNNFLLRTQLQKFNE